MKLKVGVPLGISNQLDVLIWLDEIGILGPNFGNFQKLHFRNYFTSSNVRHTVPSFLEISMETCLELSELRGYKNSLTFYRMASKLFPRYQYRKC